MVVVDKFSKYAHFLALAHPFTAFQVAQVFMQHVFKLHGLSQSIISDRDRVFTSLLWRELFWAAQTQLRMSTAYHPQTDGQTERVNQCVEAYLRCFVHACPTKWFHWLYQSTGTTPLYIPLWANPPLRFCMATHPGISAFVILLSVIALICRFG